MRLSWQAGHSPGGSGPHRKDEHVESALGSSADSWELLKQGIKLSQATVADYMVRGNPLGNQNIMAEGYEHGFGFLKGVAIDQHFLKRKRTADMSALMDRYPQLLGIGIDESTAVVVGTDLQFAVLCDRTVMIIDARQAGPVHLGKDRHLAATDLRVHILVEGDRFDLKRGRPIRRGHGRT